MMLAMTITHEFFNAPMRHELGVMSGGWEETVVYVHPSGCVLHTFLQRRSFLGNSAWWRSMLQPWWDVQEESVTRCAQSRLVLCCLGHLVENSAWKPTNPRLFPDRSFYFGGCPFVQVVFGNVGDGSLNGSHGGSYKTGVGVIR